MLIPQVFFYCVPKGSGGFLETVTITTNSTLHEVMPAKCVNTDFIRQRHGAPDTLHHHPELSRHVVAWVVILWNLGHQIDTWSKQYQPEKLTVTKVSDEE